MLIKLCNTFIDEKYIVEKIEFSLVPQDFYNADWDFEDERARRFAKELGFKPDSAGDCQNVTPTLDLINSIIEKAERENGKVGIGYNLSLSYDYDTEWYIAEGEPKGGYLECSEWDEEKIGELKAYAMPSNIRFTTVGCHMFTIFREDIVSAITDAGFKGVDFVWQRDIGRYKAKQYFAAYPQKMLPHFYCYRDENLSKSDIADLPEHVMLIHNNNKEFACDLPLAVDKKTLPETDCDFVGISTRDFCGTLLIRKNCRDFLIEKGLAKITDFEPVLVVDKWDFLKARPYRKRKLENNYCAITEEQKELRYVEYLKHLKKEKPIRVATENIALKELRLAKREDPDSFGKRTSEKILQSVLDERLIPYYKVANGGSISDEYEFLSVSESIEENNDFYIDRSEDCIIPKGAVVFGKAADGEYILLLPDGKVVRYQQDELQTAIEWPCLAAFFLEEIQIN